jgi:hypothetical protein
MDEQSFQKELSKYKVVRSSDYYKPKTRTKVSKQTTVTSANNTKDSVSPVIINTNESNFWELMSSANTSILTTAESIKFIEALKKVR